MKWPTLKPFIIGTEADPYLKRWFIVPRNPWFNIYLHHFHRSDDDRANHDHPWRNMSILLHGSYFEHLGDGSVVLRDPTWKFWRWPRRNATWQHRVELIDGRKVWTLFITGRKVRVWGFYCQRGWIPWTEFVTQRPGGNEAGPGCE